MTVSFQPRFNNVSRPMPTNVRFGNKDDAKRERERLEELVDLGLAPETALEAPAQQLIIPSNGRLVLPGDLSKDLVVITGDDAEAQLAAELREARRSAG